MYMLRAGQTFIPHSSGAGIEDQVDGVVLIRRWSLLLSSCGGAGHRHRVLSFIRSNTVPSALSSQLPSPRSLHTPSHRAVEGMHRHPVRHGPLGDAVALSIVAGTVLLNCILSGNLLRS